MQIPPLGFGTFRLTENVAYQSVASALEAGFRHIDTAQAYNNEQAVGQAINDSGIARDQLFITTKVWNDNLSPARFIPSVKESLAKLAVTHLDLLLIHWPCPAEQSSLIEIFQLLKQAKSLGLTKEIGVSNFTIAQLQQCQPLMENDEFWLNQVEVHPYLQNTKLRDYCQQSNIHVTAYMPFAVGKVLHDEVIKNVAEQHNTSAAEVVLAWIFAKGMSTIPSSTKPRNMQANIASLNLQLTNQQIADIDTLDRNDRQANPEFSPLWD